MKDIMKAFLMLFVSTLALSSFALPAGFQNEIVLNGLQQPVYLAQLPDDRMLVLAKTGNIYIFDPTETPPVASLYLSISDVETGQERGLTSIAIDPDFATTSTIYVYYTKKSNKRNRISTFLHQGNTADPTSEVVIWQDNENWKDCCHYGGGIGFGPDGKLYLTTGEEFEGAQAQRLTSAGGKIIRINKDGSIPNDNPFVDGPGGNLDEIWAYGLRNPYRAYWDLVKNRFYISEVGGNERQTAREDLHIGRKGANYGWPFCEGQCADPAHDDPVYDYGHTTSTPGGGAITAGFVYRGSAFPASYNEAFFFADYAQGFIKYLTFNQNGSVQAAHDFAVSGDGIGAPVHLIQGADGALYYVDYLGSVKRIVYSSGNQAPEILYMSASQVSGPAPLTVNFTADADDLENDPLTYTWHFGNGVTATSQSPTYQYTQNGKYNAYFVVSDGNRSTLSPQIPIQVGMAPLINITSPADGYHFRAGEVINFSASGSDPDGVLNNNSYEWMIDFGHNAHVHPALSGYVGAAGQFTINTSGHDYHDNTSFIIKVTATDSDGLTTSKTVTVYPDKVDLSFLTNVPGIPVFIDGLPFTAPFIYDSLKGFNHVISMPASYCVDDVSYQFDSWQHQGLRTFNLLVPESDASFTANFVSAGDCGGLPADGLVFKVESTIGVQTNNGVVSSWIDQSGLGNHLLSAGEPRLVHNQLNGRSVVDFDGGNDRLFRNMPLTNFADGAEDRTMIALVNYRGVGFGGVAYGQPACGKAFGSMVTNNGYLAVQGWCSDFVSSSMGTNAGWLIQSIVLQNNTFRHFSDGAQIGQGVYNFNTVLERLALGAELNYNHHINMQIAAVYIYNRALTNDELENVNEYIGGAFYGELEPVPPLAVNDAANVPHGSFASIDVLANDSDPDGTLNPASVTVVSQPTIGTVQVDAATGRITYSHNGSGAYIDEFSYTVADNSGLISSMATVSINVVAATSSVTIQSPASGSVVAGTQVNVSYSVSGAGHDHLHLSLDGGASVELVGLTGEHTFTDVTPGAHTVTAQLVNAAHQPLQGSSASSTVSFTSQGEVQPGMPIGGVVLQLLGSSVNHNNGLVTSWQDMSGSGNHLNNVTGDPELLPSALHGHAVVDFDGTGDELVRAANISGLPAGGANRTVLMVVKYDGNGYGGFAYGQPSCGNAFGLGVTNLGRLFVQRWCNDYATTVMGRGAGWLVQSAVLSSGNITHYVNGDAIASNAASFSTTVNRIVLGAEIDYSPAVDMQVAAVYVYDRALSAAEIDAANDFLYTSYLEPPASGAPTAQNDMADVVQGGQVVVNVLTNDLGGGGSLDPSSVVVMSNPAHGVVEVSDLTGAITYRHGGASTAADSFTYTVTNSLGQISNAASVAIGVLTPSAMVNITSPYSNQNVTGPNVVVTYSVAGTDFDHLHLSLNGQGHNTIYDMSGSYTFTNVPPGVHTVTAQLVNDSHQPLVTPTATASVTFTVLAPTQTGMPTNGLVLRLEASGVTESGGVVSGWSDQSGRGNHLNQVFGDPQLLPGALNGHSVVDFDGTGDELVRPSSITGLPAGGADRTMVLVVNYRGNGFGGLAYGETGCGRTFGVGVTNVGKLFVQRWCNDYISTVNGSGTGWKVQTAILSSGNLTHYINGSSIQSVAGNFSTLVNRIVLGAEIDHSPAVNMQVAAVYIYDRALSSAEINAVHAYLQAHYLESPPPNAAPVAANDDVSVVQSAAVPINVLNNDTDADSNISPSTVVITTPPVSGSAVVSNSGVITYTHNGSASLSDSFAYRVSDAGGLASNVASVNISIDSLIPIPGLVMRLEPESVTHNAGAVTAWQDLSGFGNHLDQMAGNPQFLPSALNGRGLVDFDGVGDILSRSANINGLPSGGADRTMVLVVNYQGNGFGGFAYGQASCGNAFGLGVTNKGKLFVQRWCNDYISTLNGPGAGLRVHSATLSSGNLVHFMNGTQVASVAGSFSTIANRIVMGAEIDNAPTVDMQVAAAYIYNRALTPTELGGMYQFLQSRYLATP
jgi:glucose/arabinose dehydrogenase